MARYTAQEMRKMVNREKFKCSFVTRTLNGGIILDCTSDVRAMLLQAADLMEREKKYEYAVKFLNQKEFPQVDDSHFDDYKTAMDMASCWKSECEIVRREVGSWEGIE